MLRTLTSTAIAAALAAPLTLATPALADGHVMSEEDMAQMIRTRDITGGPIYSIAAQYDEATWGDTAGSMDAWDVNSDGVNQIGEIEDIVLDRSGQMIGLIAEIGGFLDIGDKHVVLPVDDLRLQAIDDRSYAYVTRFSEEQLEQLPGVDEGFWD
ncbi:PRC-barrel domain-containing protein [uncultured Jannaschia sp.]|uniref:PRC-barrel domain-containing protein n=1 Tax=uncultured Jannaschia sp. TaxID=293347 RepID=UPI0026100102|nr:PRC-barrel domain-containing protein [uncultured Jannaschia sp.]